MPATWFRLNPEKPIHLLKKAGVQYTAHHYPGTHQGFHNDTNPRYDEAAAKFAWQRTLEFFNKALAVK